MDLLILKDREGAVVSRLMTSIRFFLPASLWLETEIPTRPGVYWFQSKTMAKAIKVDVREKNGELTVWWPQSDKAVTHLKGHWQLVHQVAQEPR